MTSRRTSKLPFVFLNLAMSADGKIAGANRVIPNLGSKRDKQHMMELRTQADAIMSGARTVDLNPVTLGPGSEKYRRARLRKGLSEYNLRVIVSGSGSIDPRAEIFRHRFSPIIVLTTRSIPKRRRELLEQVGANVKMFGDKQLDFLAAFRWLREQWKVKRLLCEGGGELNGALFGADVVDEIHLTLCPQIVGGRAAPTIADGEDVPHLADAKQFKLTSAKRVGDEMFLVYARARRVSAFTVRRAK
jgi:riboflavin-specific deaminase-like protein